SITNFKASKTFSLQQLSQDDVFAQIKNEMLSENLFSAVKIYGTFKNMHVRMMPAQQQPYTRLIDSARRQPEEKRQNIRGA
ncbi:acetolactate decarboxylase, partial [Staphylococcus aureus]|nr:acetolactate decarboxylase [Staphylococcus aureus]